MGWTKRELVQEAYGELAIAGYAFDLSPEEMLFGMRRMDTMLAAWALRGIRLGYSIALTPSAGDLDDDSGIPLTAVEAVYLNLAIRLAAAHGKAISQSTRTNASVAFNALLAGVADGEMREQQMPAGMPSGSGNKVQQPFIPAPDTSAVRVNQAGNLDFISGA